jgi:hypothetical protein
MPAPRALVTLSAPFSASSAICVLEVSVGSHFHSRALIPLGSSIAHRIASLGRLVTAKLLEEQGIINKERSR